MAELATDEQVAQAQPRIQYFLYQEQLIEEMFTRWKREHYQLEWYHRTASLSETVAGMIGFFTNRYDSAVEAHAAYVEHTLIALRAMHMIAKSSYGLTHRDINARLDVLCATIDEAVRVMLEERSNGLDTYADTPFSRKDWDTRRLASERNRLQREVDELKKRLESQNGAH